MRSRLFAPVLAIAALTLGSCSTEPVSAPANLTPQFITNGTIDQNNTYSNVGAFIVKSPTTGQIFPICTGTLISATAFLTAGHCTDYFNNELAPAGYTAYVSFSSPIGFGSLTNLKTTKLIAVTKAVTNPAYNQRQSDSGDLGVLVVAARDTKGVTPATLPALGLLDQLQASGALQTGTFTAVGYGLQDRVTGGGQPVFTDVNPIPRMFAFSSFNSLGPGYLRLSQNASTGNGGTCYGDSGGPNFLTVNGKLILVATTVTGDTSCRSTNVDARLDTASAQAFLSDYILGEK